MDPPFVKLNKAVEFEAVLFQQMGPSTFFLLHSRLSWSKVYYIMFEKIDLVYF